LMHAPDARHPIRTSETATHSEELARCPIDQESRAL